MVNFTLPAALEVDQNEEDRNEEDSHEEDRDLNIIERKVKKWTLSKMEIQFDNWKKRLDKEYVRKEKTPVLTGAYEKIKDHWDAFVEYKTSEEAKKSSEINKKMLLKRSITILWGKEAISLASLSERK
jgi:hypothetical protein